MSDGGAMRAAKPGFALMTAAALLLAGGAPRSATAQSAAQFRARMVSALHNRRVVLDSLAILHAQRATDLPPDSITSGVIRVRYSATNLGADLQATLAAAVRRAGTIADAQLGDVKLDSSAESVVLVTRIEGVQLGALSFGVVRIELPGNDGRISVLRQPITQRKLVDAILDMIGTLATQQAPANMIRWAGFWAPSRPLSAEDWRNAALDLTTSGSSITRTCYAGSVPACESSLGLTVVRDTLVEWYAPEGWRALVSEWQPPADSTALRAARAECVEKKVMETCKRLARQRRIPIPLNMWTRSTLFDFAIERGGRAAYSRLRGATGTPLEILATVAGEGPTVLVNEWRARVLAAVPHSAVPSGTETSVLIAWTLVFGFAATRRRPWR